MAGRGSIRVWLCLAAIESCQHLIPRSEQFDPAFPHHEQVVHVADQARFVGNKDDRTALRLKFVQCLEQCLFALSVEIGVGFIQYDDPGLPIERPGQANPLRLPGRKLNTAFTEFGVEAFGQAQDQFVGVGSLGSLDDGLTIARVKAADVLGDRAGRRAVGSGRAG